MTTDSTQFPVHHARVRANDGWFHVIEQGAGPAVLFCHGFPDTAETWRRQMLAVAQAGYRAVALDLRGFGQSHAPDDASEYTGLHIVGDLMGVLDALDIPDAVLVGHDWGADHAQRAAVMRPDRVRALVSLSIPFAPRGDMSTWESLRKQGLGDRYYAFEMMRTGAEARFEPAARSIPGILYWTSASPPPGSRWDPLDASRRMGRPAPATMPDWVDPDYLRHTVQAFERSGFHGGLNHYRAAQQTFDLMAAFKNAVIRQPSLYLWGAEDGLCQLLHATPPTLEDMRRAQPGLVDVIRLENVGHWIQHEAADRLNEELVKFLRGLDSKTVDHALTPLMIAAGLGEVQTVERLLRNGADVNTVDPQMGATALHKAAQGGNTAVIAQLLDHGAFIDQQSPVLGNTALMDAVLHKHEAAVRLLLARGARTAVRNHWQQTALEMARDDGLKAIARAIDQQHEKSAEQLHALGLIGAVKAGDLALVEQRIAAGADVDERVPITGTLDDNSTPLGIAAREGRTDIVQVLLAAGADPRQLVGLMQGTALHEAAYFGHADVVRTLTTTAEKGATPDLDKQGPYNGLTALHDAVWHGHQAAVEALLEAGARRDLKTHAGLTPRALAELYGYHDIARLLAEADTQAEVAIAGASDRPGANHDR